ncbi:hypothetical protein [Arthrobacter sp. M4]|uniref:hypothetical protein n=1 Tax=Arthrobacter sp. M4 TaxID=218160 RepID=UPI001CDB73E9|nr:hypothetical protein [Arthrobacter sp. M4]MCA4134833.1 hypothetical protein [Arthrobacter sp. M4]
MGLNVLPCAEPVTRAVEGWEDLTESLPATQGWMHSGIAVDATGTIYCAHPEGYALLEIAPGRSTRIVPVPFPELHGIALSGVDGVLAVADPGYRMTRLDDAGHYLEEFTPGHAAFVDVSDGGIVVEFAQPDIDAYRKDVWRPTSITTAVTAAGEHEVWIADGYGANLVHRFTGHGTYRGTVDGSESGRVFDCPHGILLRTVDGDLEVVVADRSHHRLVRLHLDGTYKGEFGENDLDSPSSLAMLDGHLYVTELFGGIAEFDASNNFVRTLETRRGRSTNHPGWPNEVGTDGNTLAAPSLEPAVFNSPHGLTSHGDHLLMTEWLIGGRLARIAPNVRLRTTTADR